jgi:hypothetical protein
MVFLKTTWKILARKRSKGKAILIKMHSILQNGKLVRPPQIGATKLLLIKPNILSRISKRAIQCGGFWGFRFFWVTSKEVPRVDSRKSPVEVKKSQPSKIYLAL